MTAVRAYRKKPVVIEARQWDGTAEGATPIIEWVLSGGGTATYDDGAPYLHSSWCCCDGRGVVPGQNGSAVACPEVLPTGERPPTLSIRTLEGSTRTHLGDWIIQGVQGEFYACKPDIFATMYEAVDDQQSRISLAQHMRDAGWTDHQIGAAMDASGAAS